MSLANISYGPANCMKFNSSFLYYTAFFILLVIGYMWGKRNGNKEKPKESEESKPKESEESKPKESKPKPKSKKSKKSKK
jgi:hypothetical protein